MKEETRYTVPDRALDPVALDLAARRLRSQAIREGFARLTRRFRG